MIKQLINQLNFAVCAEIALLLFALVFAAVVIRTLLTRSEVTNQQSRIVLGEKTEESA